ncbi:ribonuclease HII [Methylobrevis pamukkalensis]|uniref:Ribonuclease HII n=1 Tax=Methylobrevis pamukkalensis TaxID=1439726 RepID=A0A1E3GZU3_9HYPH|nr:ribonuclease HII [Methylobrevis pamukkalensis]ODN69445.1 Ribonuclease HII [Methylobrevis pamukkalensis]
MAVRTRSPAPLLPGFADVCDRTLERAATLRHGGLVAGVDEAGRGPWAGPVVTAAVILVGDDIPAGLDDSKKLTAARREAIFEEILLRHVVAVASASPATIDRINIRAATLGAMRRAVAGLALPPAAVLVDGKDVPPGLACPGEALIKGDGRVAAIAAASIVAKVTRDRLMWTMSAHFPDYGFEAHVGYGTAQHQAALARLGPCALHRMSFRPIRDVMAAG